MEAALPDSIVITASRLPEDHRLTGRRVTVWTAQDLATLPVSSFDELLRTVGGVEVQSRGGFGVQSDLTMRGSSFNGVLLLLDGARLNDPMTGHFLSDFPVPLSEIARIEVLRGPATSLYGPDALGGVIQIFTYAGLEEARATSSRFDGTAHVQVGDRGLYDLDAAMRHRGNGLVLSAATSWQGSDGMPIRSEDGRFVRGTEGDVRTDFTRRAHTVALARSTAGTTLFARAGMDDRDFGAFHFYTPFPSDTARETTSTYWAQFRVGSRPQGRTQWRLQAAAKQHEDRYVYNPQTPANEHTSRLFVVQGDASYRPGRQLVLSGGASASVRAIDSNNLGRHDDASAGAFVFARWQAFERFTVNASGRLDYDPGFGLEGTPQVSAAYNTGMVTLRAGVSRAVRAPNYIERYFNTTLARPRGRSLGNPDLKAERAWMYEAGLDLYPVTGVSAHLSAFTRTTRNLIDYIKLSPADTVFLASNLLSVRTKGLEMDVAVTRTLGSSRVRAAVSYTWLDAHLSRVREGVEYKYALTHARHLVQGNAAFDVRRATVGVQGLWKERLTGDAYGVVNVRLAYRLRLWDRNVALTGQVRNLFDVRYAEVFDAPMPGRWWILGLRIDG